MATHKIHYTTEKIPIENLNQIFKEKLDAEFEVSLNKKGANIATKTLTGNHNDTILISKNAYHTSVITLQEETDKTYIHFNEAPSKG